MTENDNDPMEKRNEFIDHPSYIFENIGSLLKTSDVRQKASFG